MKLNKLTKTSAILAGSMMFAGSAGAATTFTENFESGSAFGGGTGGAFGTYTTGQNFSGDPHSNVTSGGGLYGHLIGVANPAVSDAVDLSAGDVTAAAAGTATYSFSAWLASYTSDTEAPQFSVEFFDATGGGGSSLGTVVLANGKSITGSSDAATPGGAWNDKNWSLYTANGSVPTNTQSFRITYSSVTDVAGTAGGNDAYADNVEFTVVPEPSSTALLGLGGLALILRRRK